MPYHLDCPPWFHPYRHFGCYAASAVGDWRSRSLWDAVPLTDSVQHGWWIDSDAQHPTGDVQCAAYATRERPRLGGLDSGYRLSVRGQHTHLDPLDREVVLGTETFYSDTRHSDAPPTLHDLRVQQAVSKRMRACYEAAYARYPGLYG